MVNGEESTASAAAWAEELACKKKKTKSVIEHEDQPDAPSVGCVAAPSETASAASPKRKKRRRTRRKSSPVQHRVAQFEPHHAFRNSAVHVIMPMLADVGNGKLQLMLRHPFPNLRLGSIHWANHLGIGNTFLSRWSRHPSTSNRCIYT